MTIPLAAATVVAVMGCALMAGVYFTFSAFAIRALGELPAEQAAAAMRAINRVILRSLFIAVFLGTAALSVGLGVVALVRWGEPGMAILLAACLLYLSSVVSTVVFNVPRNQALEATLAASLSVVDAWARFTPGWMAWNHVRTVTTLAACAAFAWTLSYS